MKEPIGVVGCITPWNYPLNQIGAKVAYTLAAGCTVVLKPSEVAPVNAFILAEIIDDLGFPPGVFNLATGVGPVVGEALAAHPDVDMVSFTGSTRAGDGCQLAAPTIKRVALELGGKSPNVLLDEADFAAMVPAGVGAAYMNSGQTQRDDAHDRPTLASRRGRGAGEAGRRGLRGRRPVRRRHHARAAGVGVQRERVRGYIQQGLDEGATLVTGGADAPEGLEQGFFVKPTVFSNVTTDMTIAEEEIFGPVLVLIPYDTDDEAVEIANDTVYGLAGAVSGSDERARAVARKIPPARCG